MSDTSASRRARSERATASKAACSAPTAIPRRRVVVQFLRGDARSGTRTDGKGCYWMSNSPARALRARRWRPRRPRDAHARSRPWSHDRARSHPRPGPHPARPRTRPYWQEPERGARRVRRPAGQRRRRRDGRPRRCVRVRQPAAGSWPPAAVGRRGRENPDRRGNACAARQRGRLRPAAARGGERQPAPVRAWSRRRSAGRPRSAPVAAADEARRIPRSAKTARSTRTDSWRASTGSRSAASRAASATSANTGSTVRAWPTSAPCSCPQLGAALHRGDRGPGRARAVTPGVPTSTCAPTRSPTGHATCSCPPVVGSPCGSTAARSCAASSTSLQAQRRRCLPTVTSVPASATCQCDRRRGAARIASGWQGVRVPADSLGRRPPRMLPPPTG